MRRLAFILFLLPALMVRADEVFKKDVLPVLQKHCYGCHGEKKQKGKLRLDTLDLDFDRGPSAERWHDSLNNLNLGEMPPEDEPPLTDSERVVLTGWLTQRLEAAAVARRNAGGQAVLRRLNRTEYQYTMADLLGLEMDYSGEFPSDALSADGFYNNGASLGMSALQIENYLKTARKALDFILVEGDQPERKVSQVKRNTGKVKGPGSRRFTGDSSDRLGRVNYWHGYFKELPRTGRFTIRIKASTDRKPGQPAPVLFVRYGYSVSGLTLNIMGDAASVPISSATPQYYEIISYPGLFPYPEAHVPADKLNGVITLQNVLVDGKPATKQEVKLVEQKDKNGNIRKDKKGNIIKRKIKVYPEDPDFPRIIIDSVEFVRHDYASWPPPLHREVVPEGEDLRSDQSVGRVLQQFLQRAWRRPVIEGELEQWTSHFKAIQKQGGSDMFSLKETLAAALASSKFIYLAEPHSGKKSRKLSAHELASRLSYFLWSSMPDEELSVLADSGRLLEGSVLQGQFERMLKDPKSNRFAKEFCDQWLDLEGVDRVAINPQYYKNFDNRLKPYMAGETRAFFREILRSNTSALQFLDADFTMLNAPLAKHYGLEGPKSQNFERVSLHGTNRPGGVLGHASTHLAGSDGADSHPIKRAVWLLDRVLGTPPASPPPDVPLPDTNSPKWKNLSVREQLALHREKAACANCHKGIDPWGIAFEGYDAIGLLRKKTARRKKPVSTEVVLPGNHEISGLADLQEYLLTERRDQFAKALATKLLTYALGRSLKLEDELLIDELSVNFAKDDYRLSGLMKNIVTSRPFLSR